ncbi:LPS export ABC transporter periplasmic protein LptC [Aquifex aeolicus]|uniref:Uncharacterized protein aq_2172 n=1 Tax=Aquifex aeolicus (strain VF5) TaxID=224324 RepID=Y2172_AQUAE|nr:LPS export ABC transporter periplasmic protein LptC [Aquifex aeolicus]O67921.1 RecName: Full=Uncharacterized protein aq_2172; Flags: Precursor [Aquifex aeolicus VF5]AAC07890.1 putative protein [Aquifex aeolicus VF5]
MIRGFFLILLFLLLAFFSENYVRSLEKLKEEITVRSELKGVEIQLYGEKGLEWRIQGKTLTYADNQVVINEPVIRTQDYTITSEKLYMNKKTRKGRLEGNVEIRGPNLYLRTTNAYIDLVKNISWGYNELILRKDTNVIKGRGFKIFFKPFKVQINEVESIHTTS